MRSRIVTIAVAVLATAAVATVGGFVLFSGSGEEVPSALTSSPTTTAVTTTTTLPTTTSTSTTSTTTTIPPRVSIEVVSGPGSPSLLREVIALYEWLVDPAAETPSMIEGLADHLDPARTDTTLLLEASVSKAKMEDGTRLGVVLIGDDVVLAVAEASRWQIVGARMTSLESGPWYGDPIRYVFIIGTDARPHQSQPDLRADSIHIVAASLDQRGGAIVGFPRDTYVAASYGGDKFSSVNVRASTGEMVRIAEDLSGLEMEGYILTGFAGFRQLVNGVGGVEVDIPFAMSDRDSNAYFDPGPQVLKGGKALAFSRNRHLLGGDFTRSRHQGVVITAALAGVQDLGIQRLPKLIVTLNADSWTDLSPTQLLQLGAIAFELDPSNVGNTVLPGKVGSANGVSVVRLTSAASLVFEDLADGVVSGD